MSHLNIFLYIDAFFPTLSGTIPNLEVHFVGKMEKVKQNSLVINQLKRLKWGIQTISHWRHTNWQLIQLRKCKSIVLLVNRGEICMFTCVHKSECVRNSHILCYLKRWFGQRLKVEWELGKEQFPILCAYVWILLMACL